MNLNSGIHRLKEIQIKENNLNYLEFWNINELKDWLKFTI